MAASQQAGEGVPDGGGPDQALPPPPPKPHSTDNKDSTSSRADGDVTGECMHACATCCLVLMAVPVAALGLLACSTGWA